MNNPFRVLENSSQVCVVVDCPNRRRPSHYEFIRRLRLTVFQTLFLMLSFGLFSGFLALRVHAQSSRDTVIAIQGEQIKDARVDIAGIEGDVKLLTNRVNHLENEAAVAEGVGMAFTGLLTFLQIFQIWSGKQKSG